jgi:hypothetical protein
MSGFQSDILVQSTRTLHPLRGELLRRKTWLNNIEPGGIQRSRVIVIGAARPACREIRLTPFCRRAQVLST